jgi:nucleotide-binding universal stress UspA family protein
MTTLAFPWPEPSSARGAVALGAGSTRSLGLRAAAVRRLDAETRSAKQLLARRWPDAWVVALHEGPADAIFSEARRFRAQAIAVGWRGHGRLRRWVAGSVSRSVASRSRVPVLVARRAVEPVRRVVIAFDGSAGARGALRFWAGRKPRRGPRAVLGSVMEPMPQPDGHPSRDSLRAAQIRAKAGASILKRAGWQATVDVRIGAPLETLLRVSAEAEGSVLILGARATAGVKRLLLGSVAEGVLDRARVPVVIVP